MSIIKNSEHSVKDLEKINTVIDPRQRITALGGIWWLRSFIERLGVGDCWYGDPASSIQSVMLGDASEGRRPGIFI